MSTKFRPRPLKAAVQPNKRADILIDQLPLWLLFSIHFPQGVEGLQEGVSRQQLACDLLLQEATHGAFRLMLLQKARDEAMIQQEDWDLLLQDLETIQPGSSSRLLNSVPALMAGSLKDI